MKVAPRRHFIIPDLQCRPGVPTDHHRWIAQALVEYRPDVVVNLGDHWDMPSMSTHEVPGSEFTEGLRYKADIEAGNLAFKTISCLMDERIEALARNHKPRWTPRKIFLFGNHEDRISRFVAVNPKFRHIVSIEDCETLGWERHAFGKIVEADGVLYSHFFSSPHSGRAIGGTAHNRLTKICKSFVMGHVQGLDYGTKILPTGKTLHGIVAGSCYPSLEHYRGVHQRHWRGVVILNGVEDGEFDVMPLTLKYLCQKYEGRDLVPYMTEKYPNQDWSHLS
jgi:hypothetical protein